LTGEWLRYRARLGQKMVVVGNHRFLTGFRFLTGERLRYRARLAQNMVVVGNHQFSIRAFLEKIILFRNFLIFFGRLALMKGLISGGSPVIFWTIFERPIP
jgi:hypothetical protein